MQDFTDILTAIGVGSLCTYFGLFAMKFLLSWRYASNHREAEVAEARITVMQPILSGDAFLEPSLRRNLELAPASATFLWLVDEDDAEAWRIAEPLAAQRPDQLRLLSCPPVPANVNPKSFKLQYALARIETPYVAVLDDDTILEDQNLGKAIDALDLCDLYTGLPCYLPGGNFWSSLVTHFVNNNSIVTYLPLLNFMKPVSINGMFYVMQTQKLRDIGGFTPILDQLCDDYALARLVKSHGGVIRQAITPLQLHTTVTGMGNYIRLMHRWFVFANVLTRDQPIGVLAVLFVFLGLPPMLLWLSVLTVFGGWLALALPIALVVRHCGLRLLHRLVFGRTPAFSVIHSLLAELLQPLHWLHATLQNTLRWRTRTIRLERNGTFSTLTEADQ